MNSDKPVTPYFIGVDIGTSSVKCVAFSASGEMLHRETLSYGIMHGQPGRSEQDPDEILASVVKGIQSILVAFQPIQPGLISFSAAMHSLLAVDADGRKLTNCITWADNRAAEFAASLRNTGQGMDWYQRSGVPIHPMSPFCKLLWFKKNSRQLQKTAYKFIGIKEYVLFQLLGVWKCDISIAAATGLTNLKTGKWDEMLVSEAGIKIEQLSEIVPIGSQFSFVNRKKGPLEGLSKNIPFIIGASDGALSNIGATQHEPDALVVTVGTSSAARVISGNAHTDTHMRSFCYRIRDNEFLIGGASNNGGIVLQWLKESLLDSKESFEDFLSEAAEIEPGSNGLVFLPYLLGERAPRWNPSAEGVLFGLTIAHRKAHLVRAAMEAVIFGLYGISQTILERQAVRTIHATGGFIGNELWLQILADVFNKPVQVSGASEDAALGAVIVGWDALGIKWSINRKSSKTFQPDPERHLAYQNHFEKFERVYGQVETLFNH